jgi:death-on-curing protein
MIRILTVAQVVSLHEKIVRETGGAHGVRDYGQIEAAVARPFSGYDDQDLFPTLAEKAAALTHALAKSHPFVDGNKRIAVAAGSVFLLLNGRRLTASQEELEQAGWAIADDQLGVQELAAWFIRHSKPQSGKD